MSVLPRPSLVPFDEAPSPEPRRPRSRWRHKFGDAFRGLKLGIRGQSSFFVHFFFAALVVAAAIVLGCAPRVVRAAGLHRHGAGRRAVQQRHRNVVPRSGRADQGSGTWPCLDIAAGAVLLASIFAAVIGGLVFLAWQRLQ